MLSVAVVCSLVGIWCIISSNLLGYETQYFPLILSGVMLAFISLFEIRVGLAVLLLTIGLSPEIELYGLKHFRYEDLIFPIVFLVWASKHVQSRRRLTATDLKMPILILLFLSLFSSLNNHLYYGLELRTSLLRFGKGVEYFFIFLVVLNTLKGPRDLRAFITLMIVSSAFVGLHGLVQWGISTETGVYRLSGPPGETANILGGYYVFHMCIALGLLVRARASSRVFLIAYLGLMMIPFIMTLSRTSYVALFAGILVIWAMSRSSSIGWILVIIAVAVLLSPGYVTERMTSILDTFTGDSPSSWRARMEGWKMFVPLALQSPLLGHGIGSRELGAIDNEYVLQLNDLGVVGLLAFLWLIARCLRTSFRLHKLEESDRLLSGFAIGYLGGLAALLVHSIGATTFTTIRTTEPFFFATGLLYVYWNHKQRSMKEPSFDHHAAPPPSGSAT